MDKKIVIVGAGVAGINAATKLVDNGYPGELITIIDMGKDPYNRLPEEVMTGMGQIVEWSVRDESLHSKAGCWLFKKLLEEKPELNAWKLIKSVNEACELSVKLEFDFIDKAFEMGNIEGLTKEQLKNFIKARHAKNIAKGKMSAAYWANKVKW